MFGFSLLSIFSGFFSIGGKFGVIRKMLKKSWKWIAIILVLLVLFFYREHLLGEIEQRENKIAEQQEQIRAKDKRIEKLGGAIDEQNKRIERISQETEEQQKRFEKRKQQLKEERNQARQHAQQIMQEETPQTCDQAVKYLIEGKDQLRWKD